MIHGFSGAGILDGFCVVWIKCQAMLRAGRVSLWWYYLPFIKFQVYNPVQLYEFLYFRGWYKIFEEQTGFYSGIKIHRKL